ncbi:MAG: hypothetical protein ACRDFA_12515 [bacterium]
MLQSVTARIHLKLHETTGNTPGEEMQALLRFQGIFYLLTGLWPFVHLESFVSVVGPMPDVFQLHVTSGLIVVIAGVLIAGSRRGEPASVVLGIASALTFVVLDVAYARILRDIYWLDAAVEAAIAILLLVLVTRGRS